jgi:hypothetical protein
MSTLPETAQEQPAGRRVDPVEYAWRGVNPKHPLPERLRAATLLPVDAQPRRPHRGPSYWGRGK